MILIGLCGAAGAGKDTVAARLRERHGFWVMAFADPLYSAVSAITGMPVAALKNRDLKERPVGWIGKSPRELLQLLGTEFGRNLIREDIWIRRAMETIGAVAVGNEHAGCVITDVRFDNEAEAIRQAGGMIFEVVRPGSTCLKSAAATHSSERGIGRQHILATIVNDGSLDDLAAGVDAAVASLHADIM